MYCTQIKGPKAPNNNKSTHVPYLSNLEGLLLKNWIIKQELKITKLWASPVVTLPGKYIPDRNSVVCGGGAELGSVTGPGHAAHRMHMCCTVLPN